MSREGPASGQNTLHTYNMPVTGNFLIIIAGVSLVECCLNRLYFKLPVAVCDGCGIVAFVYWLRLKHYL